MAEETLEVESSDPLLREIDAELENSLVADDSESVADAIDDSTPDSDDAE